MATPVSNSVTPPLPSSNGTLTDEFIYGLVEGSSWQFGAGPRVLTYSFSLPDGDVFYGSGGGWQPSLEFAFESALTAWSNVANLSFAESGSGTNFQTSGANIAVTLTGYQLQSSGAVALGILPDPPLGDDLLWALGLSREQYPNPEGDLFFDDYYGAFSFLNPGGMGLTIMMHEIGHALGLNHPIDGVGPDARPGDFNSLGIGQYDAARYTIMTAEIAMGGSDAFGNAATPMPLDILAIQQIYGPNTSYHTGNDVYSPVSGAMTAIWDAGGTDTIDASAYVSGVTVDLRPGAIMDFPDATVLAVAYDNFLPGDALIENAIGGSGDDALYGNGAANRLDGGAGADSLLGGDGNDDLRGNQGADMLAGDDGADQLFGDNGNDTIAGGLGDDNVNGNNGFDTVDGGAGNDTLHGGTEFDLLFGGDGDDQVFGDKGNDTLDGGTGNDNVLGGIGNDWLAGGAGTDTLDGGTEVDTADYRSAPGAAIVDLLAGTASDGWGFTDTLILIENVTGSAFNDTLSGDLNANVLDGGAGDDSMLGGAGNDVVQGGLGNDFLRGNQGADTLVGDDGADQLFGDNGNDTIAGGLGDDNINGNNGFDTVDGGGGNDTIHGGTEADVLSGGDDDDQVFGDKANDTLDGGAGNDTIIGGLGNDWMDGGAGDDLFRYDATGLNTADVTASGVDVIKGAVTGDLVSLLGLNDELQIGGVALDALSSDALLGSAIDASNSVAFAGSVLQIDVNLDGAFIAADDFQVTLTGVTTVTYNATDDLFHLA